MVYAYRAFTLNLGRTEYLLIKVVKGRIKRPKMTCAEGTLEGELPLFTKLLRAKVFSEKRLAGYGKINKGFI
jgi:hypothetical protein